MGQGTAVEQVVRARVRESMTVKEALLRDDSLIRMIAAIGNIMAEALGGGRKIFFFGNGGSAADSQHLAAELTGRYLKERRALAGVALTTNTSILSAVGNDYGYEHVFARQLEALGMDGDIAIAISTSGNSPNVLCGADTARRKGMTVVGLAGEGGGQLKRLCHYCVCVPTRATPRIQEAHIMIGHILCEIVEEELLSAGHFS